MKIPKFTFKFSEPQIPPEVPEEFKEYVKRQNAMLFLPMYYDCFAPTISFEKFKKIWGKNRKCSDNRPENVYPRPDNFWGDKLKHQENMINELFPPEHRREVAEYAQDMLADACKEMERWHGKDWRENAKVDYDPKTAFLTELAGLLRKYDAKIRWSIGLTYKNRMQSSANIEVHTPNFSHYFSGETGVTITADNIFDYEKE